jgi:hypothetical protein
LWDRVLGTICPGWLQTPVLLISVSWVARIIDVSHQCEARIEFFKLKIWKLWWRKGNFKYRRKMKVIMSLLGTCFFEWLGFQKMTIFLMPSSGGTREGLYFLWGMSLAFSFWGFYSNWRLLLFFCS